MGDKRVVAIDMVASRLDLATSLGAIPVTSAERSPTVAVEGILRGMG